ncbi:MAG: hypothetical protein ABI193_10085, partial [Minicystis sp.]
MRTASRPGQDLQGAVFAAAEAVRLSDLAEQAIPGLQRAVGASHALLYRYDDRGRLEPIAGNLVSTMNDYTGAMLMDDPLQRAPLRMPPGPKVVLATREVDRDEYHRSMAYNEFYAPRDLEHVACTWLSTGKLYGEAGMTGLLLSRSAREEGFSPREVELLQQAMPAFVAAARRSARIEETDRERGALEALVSSGIPRALLALDGSARLLWISPSAEALLSPLLGRARALPDALS